jgi:hypothetical protein
MEGTTQDQEFWLLLYSFLGNCLWFWFYYPSQPPQDVSKADHDNLTSFPSAPPRPRPAPKYITLADLAKKVDNPRPGYRRENGIAEQSTAIVKYPASTHDFLAPPPPAYERGRWEILSAAAAPVPLPVYHQEQYLASLATFSAFVRASTAEPPFLLPQGLQDAVRPRQPPPFVFPRPKGPPSNWQCPAVYTNNPLLPRPAPSPLLRAIDCRWPPLLPRQRFSTTASRFTETAMGVRPLVSFARYVEVERLSSRRDFL